MRSVGPAAKAERRGSSRDSNPSEPRFLAIGRILRPHGVHGEMVVEVLTDFPERFDSIEVVYVGDAEEATAWQVRATRWNKKRILLKLQGCEDRTAAEHLHGLLVQIPIEEAMPLPEDEYYTHELIGLDVMTVEGEDLGRVSDVLFTGANDIYVVVGPRGQILLPAIADVIDRVDLDGGQMVVRLLEGLA